MQKAPIAYGRELWNTLLFYRGGKIVGIEFSCTPPEAMTVSEPSTCEAVGAHAPITSRAAAKAVIKINFPFFIRLSSISIVIGLIIHRLFPQFFPLEMFSQFDGYFFAFSNITMFSEKWEHYFF